MFRNELEETMPLRPRALRLMWIAMLVIFGVGCDFTKPTPRSAASSDSVDTAGGGNIDEFAAAERLLRRGDPAAASTLIQQALIATPEDPATLELAGDVEAALNRPQQMIELYESAIEHSSPPSVALFNKAGQAWMRIGRPFEAVAVLRTAVEQYPDDRKIRTDVAGLLAALGLEQEAGTHLRWLVMRGLGGLNELVMLSDLTRPQNDRAIADYAIKHAPEDLRSHFPSAREAAYKGLWESVAETLGPVVAKYPAFVPASAYYGRALVELGEVDAATDWASQLPDNIEQQPQYWLATAAMASRKRQHEQAVAAYWQAYQIDPNDGEVLGKLATSLIQAGYVDQSRVVTVQAGKVGQLIERVDQLRTNHNRSQRDAVRVAQTLRGLGRLWEAASWLRVGATMPENKDPGLKDLYLAIRDELSASTPWQVQTDLLTASMDFTDLPGFDWTRPSAEPRSTTPTPASMADQTQTIHFVDEAADRGLNHVCRVQPPVGGGESGLWIYQSGAGGAATLDYDHDGWPDVYLTVLDGMPKKRDSAPNALFQNHAGKFHDVTALSGVGETGFSQGLAVGDFNSDGFDDLYIANIGGNRLYRNNGDGTFTDVTDAVGIQADGWTSSVAMVDMNQDGVLDLFDVGYCAGDRVLTMLCEKDGEAMACLPKSFAAQPDQVWQGLPDGRFTEQTDAWLGSHSIAHGLGIVAGYFDQNDGLDLYVANDMSGNHFWSGSQDAEGDFQFDEQAKMRGLSVDNRSLPQASMGIAVGDPDADGDTDFYLTHFEGEYNTYYEQIRPGMWADLTSQVQLAAPTNDLLAFGTAWLDADNDGSPELLVANGHLNDNPEPERPYRMPMQLFSRHPDGTWFSPDPASVGEYFETARLGRSLITLDANRDGRVDALVTHLFDPVSLLLNRSKTEARAITFFLVGTRGHASAIGAMVTIESGGRERSQQLTTGSGYQAASQRCVSFGIAPGEKIDALRVRWPSGDTQTFTLDPDQPLSGSEEYLLVEGDDAPFRFQSSTPGS
ncbi:FG-GAP-like repeat-containing protein [Allorhodopirellula solitaria]|uniref:ASPIC and UnbV n=1 Tax=Allorhodopirellula solitaria TaxID=2527987 RepID=A0A5C5YFY3_9BACT|nr:FG-GAP-like repeat-containing protein [Allorhodopirellula solitaria]TWT73978.1 ASPIC and UnbV [Allorhodopirellula solitaria]